MKQRGPLLFSATAQTSASLWPDPHRGGLQGVSWNRPRRGRTQIGGAHGSLSLPKDLCDSASRIACAKGGLCKGLPLPILELICGVPICILNGAAGLCLLSRKVARKESWEERRGGVLGWVRTACPWRKCKGSGLSGLGNDCRSTDGECEYKEPLQKSG